MFCLCMNVWFDDKSVCTRILSHIIWINVHMQVRVRTWPKQVRKKKENENNGGCIWLKTRMLGQLWHAAQKACRTPTPILHCGNWLIAKQLVDNHEMFSAFHKLNKCVWSVVHTYRHVYIFLLAPKAIPEGFHFEIALKEGKNEGEGEALLVKMFTWTLRGAK